VDELRQDMRGPRREHREDIRCLREDANKRFEKHGIWIRRSVASLGEGLVSVMAGTGMLLLKLFG